MKTTNKNRKSKLLALFLSLMMLSSAGAALASCTDAEDSSSSTSSTEDSSSTESSSEKDTGLIKNSDFETFNKNDGKNVIGTSVTGWSSSTTSTATSKAKSGIIDTSDDGWKYLAGSYYATEEARTAAFETITDTEASNLWDSFSAGDKLAFYDAWEDRNPDGDIDEDFEKYEKLNIIKRDVPAPSIGNPKTHWVGTEDDYEDYKDNKNVLMIHNENPEASSTSKTIGLAQKFSSSSTVTVPAGASAEFSVWVKTADLKTTSSAGASQEAVGKGAYISIAHSVGGTSLDAYEVKNIDTEAMNVTDNNGWKQYTFYLKGAAYTDTTFTVTLGLGQSSGTKDQYEYVNGYAFFDDLRCNVISNDDYDAKAEGLSYVDITDDKIDKTVDVYEKTVREQLDVYKFALNFYGAEWDNESANILGGISDFTKTESSVGLNMNDFDTTYDVTKVYADKAAIEADIAGGEADNEYLSTVYSNFFGDTNGDGKNFLDSLENNKQILMLLSSKGTAYTAESSATFTLDTDAATADVPEYLAISFFVKTSDLSTGTGAGVTLVNGLEKTSFTSLNIYDIDGVTVGETEDVYDGWQQCFFFVKLDEDVTGGNFTLTFNYGPTDITTSTTKDNFTTGFAAFTGFQSYGMSKTEYESAQSGTYAQLVTLKGEEEEKATGNSGFDSAAGVPSNALEKGLANLANYKGVYSDSYRVSLPNATDDAATKEARRAINAYANAGLLNRDNFEDVLTASAGKAWLEGIKTESGKTTATEIWNEIFEDATQPLLIWNDGVDATRSYGYIGSTTTVSSGYKAISVRVKTSANATASVYLIDTSDDTYQTALSIGRDLIFWYDDDGNVCTGDPTEKSTQIAFKLQSNGLYKANKTWNGYSSLTDEQKNAYFANLSAYGEVGKGDLYVSENGGIHDYYDYTWNYEAFYLHEGAYYTKDNGNGEKVLNLADVSALTPRYTAETSRELKIEGISTNGEWATVTFYLNVSSDEAKNYRLEVWSGTRDGKTVNAAGTYVIFDTNNPGDAEDNFGLIDDYKDLDGVDTFESVFSYYDSDKFLRYDSELDTDDIGNVYDAKYSPSTYYKSDGVAYLRYEEEGKLYNVFADYTLSDVAVPATTETDDSSDDSSSDDEDSDSTNVWLLASSIAVAAVLVIVVAIIIVRNVVKSVRKKKGTKVYTPKKK